MAFPLKHRKEELLFTSSYSLDKVGCAREVGESLGFKSDLEVHTCNPSMWRRKQKEPEFV